MSRQADRRLLVIAGLLGAAFAFLALRAGRIQLAQGAELRALAERQQLRQVEQMGRRGSIVDRNGAPLAISVRVDSLYATPQQIRNPRQAAHALAAALGLDTREIFVKLASDRGFVWLARQVTPEQAAAVHALQLPGVGSVKEGLRSYPNRELAANLLGFVGVDGAGLEGIELKLEERLRGRVDSQEALRDGRGRLLAMTPASAELSGDTVVLTIDKAIQHAAEQALRRAVRIYGARGGTAVVLDVPSGDVLALASEPHFDPNAAGDSRPEQRRNRAIADVYEPGSVFKTMLMASAFEHGLVRSASTALDVPRSLKIGRHTVSDLQPRAQLDATDALVYSSNVAAGSLALGLGRPRLAATLARLGFGARTGIELPGESAGLLPPPESWPDIQLANIGFGQGIAVTTLQLATAYAAVAAGGLLRPPRVVKTIVGPEGEEPLPRPEAQRVLAQRTATALNQMLVEVVRRGTGRRAALADFTVAGKTGTAQKADPVSRGYAADRYTALFAGFVPAEAPRLAIAISVDEPQVEHQGGVVAAPVFREIAEQGLQHLAVPASRAPAPALAATAGEERYEGLILRTRSRLVEMEARAGGRVPPLVGLSGADAVRLLAEHYPSCDLILRGTGVVVTQRPQAGAPLDAAAQEIVLTLADPTSPATGEQDAGSDGLATASLFEP